MRGWQPCENWRKMMTFLCSKKSSCVALCTIDDRDLLYYAHLTFKTKISDQNMGTKQISNRRCAVADDFSRQIDVTF